MNSHTHTHTSRNNFTLVACWKTFSYKCPLNGRQACQVIVGAPNINHMTVMVRPVINTLNGDVTWLADSERQQKCLYQQVSFPTAAKLPRRLDKALNDRCDCLQQNECRSCKYCVCMEGGGGAPATVSSWVQYLISLQTTKLQLSKVVLTLWFYTEDLHETRMEMSAR